MTHGLHCMLLPSISHYSYSQDASLNNLVSTSTKYTGWELSNGVISEGECSIVMERERKSEKPKLPDLHL